MVDIFVQGGKSVDRCGSCDDRGRTRHFGYYPYCMCEFGRWSKANVVLPDVISSGGGTTGVINLDKEFIGITPEECSCCSDGGCGS